MPFSVTIEPESGASKRPAIDSMVDFPDPEGEVSAMVLPASIANEVSSMMGVPSKDFDTFLISRNAISRYLLAASPWTGRAFRFAAGGR